MAQRGWFLTGQGTVQTRARSSNAPLVSAGNHNSRVFLMALSAVLATGLFLSLDASHAGTAARSDTHGAYPVLPGATVAPTGSAHNPALVVTSLQTGGEAERGGIRVGDRLLTVEGSRVSNPSELRRLLLALDAPTLHARLQRGTQTLSAALRRQ